MRHVVAAIFAVVAICAVGSPAWAQAKGKIKGKGDGQIRVSEADRRSTSAQELGEISIEGRMYKPSVFYVLARGALSYQGLEIKHDFVPKIMREALKRPF